ncbi:MAG: tRNA (N6-threonylcarbamoyladenosine(37)-N6)-methyltransferase TrmO [Bacteroidaceae bacterium]|nr:tRNA (N6-threonylcarbamoyladenosine(37)-N6)-methyltransferase TrmO [Bacteroidaceae bacterium]
MEPIAVIRSDFPTKFGIPRQSGIVKELRADIIFSPQYRNADALRGLEGFTHLWIIWEFSEAKRSTWSPTVRPPRLGGNTRMGVFATRSPFRPNPIGLSCVRIEGIDFDTPDGPVIHVSGADLMSGTPIYDIKPYIPYTDSHPDAKAGFTDAVEFSTLTVVMPQEVQKKMPAGKVASLIGILEQDPRPHYQDDPDRIYGFSFAGFEVHFRVEGKTLFVTGVDRMS